MKVILLFALVLLICGFIDAYPPGGKGYGPPRWGSPGGHSHYWHGRPRGGGGGFVGGNQGGLDGDQGGQDGEHRFVPRFPYRGEPVNPGVPSNGDIGGSKPAGEKETILPVKPLAGNDEPDVLIPNDDDGRDDRIPNNGPDERTKIDEVDGPKPGGDSGEGYDGPKSGGDSGEGSDGPKEESREGYDGPNGSTGEEGPVLPNSNGNDGPEISSEEGLGGPGSKPYEPIPDSSINSGSQDVPNGGPGYENPNEGGNEKETKESVQPEEPVYNPDAGVLPEEEGGLLPQPDVTKHEVQPEKPLFPRPNSDYPEQKPIVPKEKPHYPQPNPAGPEDREVLPEQPPLGPETPILQKPIDGRPRGPGVRNPDVEVSKPYPGLRDLCQTLDLKRFLTMVNRAGMTNILSGVQPVTIFAPSDEAFSSLPVHVYYRLTRDKDFLKKVLQYHMVNGQHTTSELSGGKEVIYQSQVPDMPVYLRNVNGKVMINGYPVQSTDQRANNAVVHVINHVLYPLPAKSMFATLQSIPTFTRFTALSQEVDLFDELKGNRPFTVFAPTDEAFAKLPRKTLDWITYDKEACKKLLLKHVVPGTQFTSWSGDGTSLSTINNFRLNMKYENDGYTVNGVSFGSRDIMTSDGVLHGINDVLFSKDLQPDLGFERPKGRRIYFSTH